ncbi:MAG: mucoidy inhibitor MuiA family protein [Cyclobacteriaceae bacterium]|jgi:uncharacterized protein (TIGR02231 family)|nr:mucoidy inhibitor MuiA family protein [Cytophagales bacterium]MCZ8328667.1 mucoidy inhibitor MuiA family protein [Cyclobacteriaceae bacterium]
MKKIFLVLVGFAMQLQVEAQEIVTESNVNHVTVFLNKAQVNRLAKVRIPAGKSQVVVSNLSSMLDPQSIQVSGKGKFVIEGTSVRQNYLSEVNLPLPIKVLKDSANLLAKWIQLENSQKEILTREEQLLNTNQKIGGGNQNITVAELKAMADFYRTRMTDIVQARLKHDEKINRYQERLNKINAQIQEKNAQYSLNTSEIVVNISSDLQQAVELEIDYIVMNAGWQAVYDLRATNTNSPLSLGYKASVYQNTGEQWKNVKLTLSTANPNESGMKPELFTWFLDFYQPVVYRDRSTRGLSMKKAEAPAPEATADMQMSVASEEAVSSSFYVNTTQTTLNTEFAIAIPYTIESGNKPTLVEIKNHQVQATYLYSVAPKLNQDAFLIAKATGWEEFSLLPGEANIFFEGTYVGKTFLDPGTIKDTLSVSLGRDKRINVKREKTKDFNARKTIGSTQRDTYNFDITVRNAKSESIRIVVEDQYPISNNSQIEIATTQTSGATVNKAEGKLIWNLQLQPGESKKLTFGYEVKYPKDKKLNMFE